MPAKKLLFTPDQLRRMLRQGLTHQQIADANRNAFGIPVTPVTVRSAISRLGLTGRRPRYDDEIPWRVEERHSKDYVLRMLRTWARLNRGEVVSDKGLARFESWRQRLLGHGLITVYDPADADGFYHVPRRPEDGDRLSRPPT